MQYRRLAHFQHGRAHSLFQYGAKPSYPSLNIPILGSHRRRILEKKFS